MNDIRMKYIDLMRDFVKQKKLVNIVDVVLLKGKSQQIDSVKSLSYIFSDEIYDKELIKITEEKVAESDGYKIIDLRIDLKSSF